MYIKIKVMVLVMFERIDSLIRYFYISLNH